MTKRDGYLYIIENKAWPNWLKIGTTKNIKSRLSSYQTSSPFRDYKVLFLIKHPDYLKAEKNIKEQMKMFALSIKNEWYEIDIDNAKKRLLEQIDFYLYNECDINQRYNSILKIK
jgi:hypothetical protein